MSAPTNGDAKAPILLVDDIPENLFAMAELLSSPAYDLIQVDSGAAALEQVRRREFAVVLLDVQMPGMDGFETAAEMKRIAAEQRREVPVIFVTAIDTHRSRISRAYLEGAVDFLQKPIDPDEIRSKVSVFVEFFYAKERLRRALQAAVRAREDQMTILSHDLRNPLTTALLSAKMLERNADAATQKAAKAIIRSVDRMTRLVGDLLDLAKVDAGGTLPVEVAARDVADLVAQAAELQESLAASQQIRLTVEVTRPTYAMCDGDRVQQVLDAAAGHGRKVAFVGRSMVRNMGVARDLGYLRVPGGMLVDMREAEEMPPQDVVLISTGSQGEPMSALSRMAGRDHPIRIAEGDTVILASSLIPGNETAVYRVINGLTRLGARVVHKGSSLVHVSGHAHAGELLFVLNVTKPGNFMPIHGEWRHLRSHARLAALSGVPEGNIVIADDGVVVDLVEGQATIAGAVPCGYVYVDGLSVGEVTDEQLKDRRILGDEGFVSVVIVLDSTTGKMVAPPEMHARGSGIDEAAFAEVRPRIEEALARAAAEGITDSHQIQQLVRRTVGRWVSDHYRRRPMIIPVVVEV